MSILRESLSNVVWRRSRFDLLKESGDPVERSLQVMQRTKPQFADYINPDGTCIGSRDPRKQTDPLATGHDEIAKAFPQPPANPLAAYVRHGAIAVDRTTGTMTVNSMPSALQANTMQRIIQGMPGGLTIKTLDGTGTTFEPGTKPEAIMAAVIDFFSRPIGKRREIRLPAGSGGQQQKEAAEQPPDIAVSNAHYAALAYPWLLNNELRWTDGQTDYDTPAAIDRAVRNTHKDPHVVAKAFARAVEKHSNAPLKAYGMSRRPLTGAGRVKQPCVRLPINEGREQRRVRIEDFKIGPPSGGSGENYLQIDGKWHPAFYDLANGNPSGRLALVEFDDQPYSTSVGKVTSRWKQPFVSVVRLLDEGAGDSGIDVGTRVKFSVKWLRSTGSYTGSLPFATGTVRRITGKGAGRVATIDWEQPDPNVPARVLVKNLVDVERQHLED